MVEDQHAPKRNRRTSSLRLPWCYRVCMLLILTLFGLHLLAAGSGAGSGESLSVQRTASVHTGFVAGPGILSRLAWEPEPPPAA